MPYIFRTSKALVTVGQFQVPSPLVSAQLVYRREAGIMAKAQEHVLAEAHGLDDTALANFKVVTRKAFGLPAAKPAIQK